MSYSEKKRIWDGTTNVEVDTYAKGIKVIDAYHARIHAGQTFIHSGKYSIANGASRDILIVVGAGEYPHIRHSMLTDDTPIDILLYEDTVVSANGTALNVYNCNRNSATASGVNLYNTPTITTLGTLIKTSVIVTGGNKTGGTLALDPNFEMILKPSANYLLRATNNSGGATTAEITVVWYES